MFGTQIEDSRLGRGHLLGFVQGDDSGGMRIHVEGSYLGRIQIENSSCGFMSRIRNGGGLKGRIKVKDLYVHVWNVVDTGTKSTNINCMQPSAICRRPAAKRNLPRQDLGPSRGCGGRGRLWAQTCARSGVVQAQLGPTPGQPQPGPRRWSQGWGGALESQSPGGGGDGRPMSTPPPPRPKVQRPAAGETNPRLSLAPGPTRNPKPAHRSIPVGVTAWDQSPKLPVFVLWVEVEVGTQYRGYKKPKRAHK